MNSCGEIVVRIDQFAALTSATIRVVKSKNNVGVASSDASSWVLYLLECENGTYYAGITTDLERRFAEHVFGIGARYTREIGRASCRERV